MIHDARDRRYGSPRDVGPETGVERLRFAPRRSTPSRHAIVGEPVGLAQPLQLIRRDSSDCFPEVLPPLRGHTPAGESLTLPPVAQRGVSVCRNDHGKQSGSIPDLRWKQVEASGSKVEALPLSLLDFQKRDSP